MEFFEKRKIRGAITLFLVLIMLPTMLLGVVLVDGSRVASARTMSQEAGDLAATSVLSDYNLLLKDKYGLFALNDNDKVEELYRESLEKTLMASGVGDRVSGDQMWQILQQSMASDNVYKDTRFINLYDFRIDESEVQPVYSLANQDVLTDQMINYARFRGIYTIADHLDLVKQSKSKEKEEADKKEASDKEAAAAIVDRMELDGANAQMDQKLYELSESVKTLNDALAGVRAAKSAYEASQRAAMETLSADPRADVAVDGADAITDACTQVTEAVQEINEKLTESEQELDKAIDRLKNYEEQYGGYSSETIGKLVSDAAARRQKYESSYKSDLQALKTSGVLQVSDGGQSAGDTAAKIEDGITRFSKELGAPEPDEQITYLFYYVDGGSTESVDDAAGNYQEALKKSLGGYYQEKSFEFESPTKKEVGESTADYDIGSFKEKTEAKDNAEKSKAGRRQVPDNVYRERPSVNIPTKEVKPVDKSFLDGHKDELAVNDLEASKKMLQNGSESSFLGGLATATRDDILELSYILGTFKTRMTEDPNFTAKKKSSNQEFAKYQPDWRFGPGREDGELNIRFTPKKDDKTVLRGEIEYIIYGYQSDQANEYAAYWSIFATRFVPNMIALYNNTGVYNVCNVASIGTSALTLGLVPPTVFFWIYISAWDMAETTADLYFLIDCGYKIPLFKTSDQVLLRGSLSTIMQLIDPSQSTVVNYGKSSFMVTYEDYLLLYLLLAGHETRILRTQDLVEMNMRAEDDDFRISTAYTGIQATDTVSLTYLFGSAGPFRANYRDAGYGNRMRFTSSIYMGY